MCPQERMPIGTFPTKGRRQMLVGVVGLFVLWERGLKLHLNSAALQ